MNNPAGPALYIGTMSGTSMDGLDLVAVSFDHATPTVLASDQIAYPATLRQQLLELATNPDATISRMCQLDTQLGQFYAAQIVHFIARCGIEPRQIRAIGLHGQTIRHGPDGDLPHTLQIGDPNTVQVVTSIPVVADFRRRDIALGGQGAPFAPAFHNQVFRSTEQDRVIANIGGISNITYLPRDAEQPVSGFDTGPGNTFLDLLSRSALSRGYDDKGEHARSGSILATELRAMLDSEPYFARAAPKSTGTDYFSPDWIKRSGLLDKDSRDAMATLVELTSITLTNAIKNLAAPPDHVYICGGGAHNDFLLERIGAHLPGTQISTTDVLGIHPDMVEAIAFAWLACQTLNNRPGNLPSVTNAQKFTIVGGVYY